MHHVPSSRQVPWRPRNGERPVAVLRGACCSGMPGVSGRSRVVLCAAHGWREQTKPPGHPPAVVRKPVTAQTGAWYAGVALNQRKDEGGRLPVSGRSNQVFVACYGENRVCQSRANEVNRCVAAHARVAVQTRGTYRL